MHRTTTPIPALMLVAMLAGSQAAMAMDIPDANSPAARLYAARCTACHALPHPKRLAWPAWRHTLHLMKQRMQERGMQLRADEWRQIAAYLRRHAR